MVAFGQALASKAAEQGCSYTVCTRQASAGLGMPGQSAQKFQGCGHMPQATGDSKQLLPSAFATVSLLSSVAAGAGNSWLLVRHTQLPPIQVNEAFLKNSTPAFHKCLQWDLQLTLAQVLKGYNWHHYQNHLMSPLYLSGRIGCHFSLLYLDRFLKIFLS